MFITVPSNVHRKKTHTNYENGLANILPLLDVPTCNLLTLQHEVCRYITSQTPHRRQVRNGHFPQCQAFTKQDVQRRRVNETWFAFVCRQGSNTQGSAIVARLCYSGQYRDSESRSFALPAKREALVDRSQSQYWQECPGKHA